MKTGKIFELAIVILLSAFVCFYRLGGSSFWRGDESLFVIATQGMSLDGNWWHPTWNGKPFFMKPPLKLWLNRLVTGALGESNANYRAVDAFSGVGVLTLTYLAGRILWRGSLAGLLSWLFLLGSSSWIFIHGPRYGSTDCLLLLFTTLAFLSGFFAIRNIAAKTSSLGWAAACGACVGLGVMTKSASGLIPLIVLFIYALLSGDWRNILAQGKFALLAVLGLAILIPSPYFVWHSLYSENAFATLIMQDVVGRAVNVYWNRPDPLFYLKLFTTSSQLFPPLVSIAGTLYLLHYLIRHPVSGEVGANITGQTRASSMFVLCWAVLPIFLFSFAGTKALWYVAPSFPGTALICGRIGQALVMKAAELWQGRKRLAPGSALLYLCLLLLLVQMGAGNYRVIRRVLRPQKRIPLDLAARTITKAARRNQGFEGLVLKRDRAGYSEIPYWNFLRRYSSFVSADDRFLAALFERKDFIAFPADLLPKVGLGWPFSSYFFLPPERGRENWYYLFQSGSSRIRLSGFTPAEKIYDLSTDDFLGYGWSDIRPLGPVPFRRIKARDAGIMVEGDTVLDKLGATGEFILHSPLAQAARVYLNSVPGPEITLEKGEGFSRYQFLIRPGLIHDGVNMMSIQLPGPSDVRFASLKLVAGQMQPPRSSEQ